MATKRRKKIGKGSSKGLPDFTQDRIRSVDLDTKAKEEYYEYGIEVIENRAIFSGIDGLIPVTRRSLLVAHELGLSHTAKREKSAKIVGNTLASYHPHGDGACYDSIVNAGSNCQPMFDTKEGNWGTMTEPAAAYRYTNTRLTKYSDSVFFDSFYLPAIEYVPNFDGSGKEPLILPALLPNALLNGNFGIAPGVNTRSPAFTLESLLPVVQKAVKTGECTPSDCLDLQFTTRYGGIARQGPKRKKELLDFFKTGKGKITFDSLASKPNEKNEIRFSRFAPIGDIEKLLTKVEGIKGVISAADDSDKKDVYGTAYLIRFAKSLKGKDLDEAVKKVRLAFSASWNYNIKVTDRYVKENGMGAAKLRHNTVPQMIKEWVKYRFELERIACTYWMADLDKKIAYLELMRQAIKHIDFIVKCLKDKKLSNTDLDEKVAKGLKITVEQSKQILDRPIRQLRALEDSELLAKIKEHKALKEEYASRKAKPAKYVYNHVGQMLKMFSKEAKA